MVIHNTTSAADMAALSEHASAAADLLKELANINRLMICCCLGDGELSVTDINAMVPLSQSALSQHLARLREANLLATRKESQTVYYRLADEKVLKIIATLKTIYCP